MPKKQKNKKTARILYWGTIAVLVAVILSCVGVIGYNHIGDKVNEDSDAARANEKNQLQATSPTQRPADPIPTESTEPTEPLPTEETTEPTEPTEPPVLNNSILLEYQPAYSMNSDMVGWLQIKGTKIDYPVVHTPDDPNFYLRRNFDKEDATCGTLFVRAACDVNLPSDNVTIYGHNMRNGTMFADLHKYESESFWKEHRYIYFDTLTQYHCYEVFAVFITTADSTKGFTYHIYDTFNTEMEFNKYVSTCKNMMLSTKSIKYDTGITPQFGDKLLTLSTCDKSIEDGRFVVVARRVY